MKIHIRALAALTSSLVPFSAAVRPQGDTCEDLPGGYCHQRTQQDEVFVKKWKEDKGKGPFIRRRIEDVDASPPSDPFAPAEYEPIDGILLAFDGSSTGTSVYDLDVVAGIAAAVTNQETLTKVYMVANANQKPTAQTEFTRVGVNMTRVVWVEQPIDSVWIRDYGPRYICHNETDVRGAVDTRYYSDRVNDDTLPTKLGNGAEVGPYSNFDLDVELMHSGGNGHYFSIRKAFSSRLLLDDNTATEAQIKTYWQEYKGADLHIFPQLSFNVDGTGHIDMWFLPVNDTSVIIGEWAKEDAYGSKAITDGAAQYMKDQAYTVFRTPNWVSTKRVNGYYVHYTYTNAVIANGVVVISSFGSVSNGRDSIALGVYEAAFPGHTVVQVDSSRIITRSGALHCIAQHVYDCTKSAPKTISPTAAKTSPPSGAPTSAPTGRPSTSKPTTRRPTPKPKPTTRRPTSKPKPTTRRPR
jgi:agmatine deiminase